MSIHPIFDVNPLKLYKPSMLHKDEEESITLAQEKQVAEVSAKLEEDTILESKEYATKQGTLNLYQVD